MNLIKKICPIFYALKSGKQKNQKIIYINLIWLWIILSTVTGVYFAVQHINAKILEYQHMKKYYSGYLDQPINLELPKTIEKIISVAQEQDGGITKIRPDEDFYYSIEIDGKTARKVNELFDQKLLERSVDSPDWSLYLKEGRPKNLLAHQLHPVLYNKELSIKCVIYTNKLLAKKLGNIDLYFAYRSGIYNQQLYGLISWDPSVSLMIMRNGFTVIFIFLLCNCVAGIILGMFFYLIKKTWMPKPLTSSRDAVDLTILHMTRNDHIKAFLIIKGVEFINIFPLKRANGV